MSNPVIDGDGTKYWYKNNFLHRDNDLPAVIYSDGTKIWYKNGKRHRDNNKPAVIGVDGNYWFRDGKLYFPSSTPLEKLAERLKIKSDIL